MQQDRVTEQTLRPLIFGEVLFDSFPDGSVILGGAPFNVAWHLQGFGLHPLLISRIGEDELGERILAAMSEWGMDTDGVQRDPHHPTGRVVVNFADHEPKFEIIAAQAYDFIDGGKSAGMMESVNHGLMYHGSLIARHEVSRAALDGLRDEGLSLFVDVNLRDPWWRKEWVYDALRRARWAKLNDHELRMLLSGPDSGNTDLERQAQRLRQECDLEVLVVTRGSAGAMVFSQDEPVLVRPPATKKFVDTVGAGDAFSAVTIFGLLCNWALPVTAQRAVEFASAICEMRGATSFDRDLYEGYLREWKQ